MAFVELNRRVLDAYFDRHPGLKTWKGYRLCAVDGSQLRLPNEPDIVAAFGVNPGKDSQKDCPLALASVYYDVLNHISIDFSINPTRASERDCAASHLKVSRPMDLSILDRGYNAFWLYRLYEARQRVFCMRAKTNQGLVFQDFAASGKPEAAITLAPNRPSIEQCRERGLSVAPLRLRLVRVELETGEVEVLITNLMDTEAFPAHAFKQLYHLRWGAEENYKRLKQWVEIENFSGKSALSVRQDFYAKVLATNLTALHVREAQEQVEAATAHCVHAHQVNFAQALTKMKDTLIELLMLTGQRLATRIKALIDYMACTHEPVRVGRSYPRQTSKKHNKVFCRNYKRAK